MCSSGLMTAQEKLNSYHSYKFYDQMKNKKRPAVFLELVEMLNSIEDLHKTVVLFH